ncbi:MAG TPA: O-antigen ligase family protein [Pirellulales bacterium]|nr:O-antigen ligase family protein [Pirellulales bacterium]
MSFFLFLLVTGTLFVRPAEVVSDLALLPIYEWLIVGCALSSISRILPLLHREALVRQPITLAVFGLLAAVFLSHISHGDLWRARYDTLDFSKIVVYYLLLVANINSAGRLRTFLFWLLGCITILGALALLEYHGIVHIESLTTHVDLDIDEETGEEQVVRRMCGMGIFNDPNDLSMIVVVGMALAAYFFFDPRLVIFKVPLAATATAFLYALLLTKSRGGLLAMVAAGWALFHSRYGWKKAAILGAFLLPAGLLLVTGRQADIGGAVSAGTGQSRIQLWSAGLQMFRANPLFGIGFHLYAEEAGQVAHNSYVHAFGELGLFGGAFFLGAWYCALRDPYQLGQAGRRFADADMGRLQPYLLAALTGFATGMMSLERIEVVPTYLMLGLASAYLALAHTRPPFVGTQFDGKLVKRVLLYSIVFLITVYVFVRVFSRWSG